MVNSSVLLSQGDVPIKLLRAQMSSQCEQHRTTGPKLSSL